MSFNVYLLFSLKTSNFNVKKIVQSERKKEREKSKIVSFPNLLLFAHT